MKQMINRLKFNIKILILKSICSSPSKALQSLVDQHGYEQLFRGWLNNRMTVFLMMIENPKPRDPKSALRIQFFLEDLRHHYLPTVLSEEVDEAFSYLQDYLKIYPYVVHDQCVAAKQMINRIYEALGYDEPVLSTRAIGRTQIISEKRRMFLFQELASV